MPTVADASFELRAPDDAVLVAFLPKVAARLPFDVLAVGRLDGSITVGFLCNVG